MEYNENNAVGVRFKTEAGNIWEVKEVSTSGIGVVEKINRSLEGEIGFRSTVSNLLNNLNHARGTHIRWEIIEPQPVYIPTIINNYIIF